jgi:hypothetical protein
MQVIRRSRESYAAQFVDRTGKQIAEIEANGSNKHGWRHQFLSYRVTFASTAEQNQRLVVLGAIPILHMTYIAPRG